MTKKASGGGKSLKEPRQKNPVSSVCSAAAKSWRSKKKEEEDDRQRIAKEKGRRKLQAQLLGSAEAAASNGDITGGQRKGTMPSAVPAVGFSDSGTAAIETQQTKAVSQQAHDASPAAFEKVPPQLGVAPRQTNGLEDHPVAKEVADGVAATVDALTGPGDGVFLADSGEGGEGSPVGHSASEGGVTVAGPGDGQAATDGGATVAGSGPRGAPVMSSLPAAAKEDADTGGDVGASLAPLMGGGTCAEIAAGDGKGLGYERGDAVMTGCNEGGREMAPHGATKNNINTNNNGGVLLAPLPAGATKTKVAAGGDRVTDSGKDEGGMGSASDGFGAKFIPGFGKQDDKLNQAKLDPKKRLATQDVRDGPLNKAGFQDPSGSIGKGKGVFAFSDKYGGNIDSYAPIYNPQTFGDDLITGMSEQQFVIFMAILAPVFLSLPLAIALKGYGII